MEENADLEELENLERTDENLRWEDIQKMNAFRKQEQYSLESLEKITEDLKESLDKMEASPSSQEEKEQLQERMDEQLQELAKNQELLRSEEHTSELQSR